MFGLPHPDGPGLRSICADTDRVERNRLAYATDRSPSCVRRQIESTRSAQLETGHSAWSSLVRMWRPRNSVHRTMGSVQFCVLCNFIRCAVQWNTHARSCEWTCGRHLAQRAVANGLRNKQNVVPDPPGGEWEERHRHVSRAIFVARYSVRMWQRAGADVCTFLCVGARFVCAAVDAQQSQNGNPLMRLACVIYIHIYKQKPYYLLEYECSPLFGMHGRRQDVRITCVFRVMRAWVACVCLFLVRGVWCNARTCAADWDVWCNSVPMEGINSFRHN